MAERATAQHAALSREGAPRHRCGFTYIEVIIVLAILAIISLVGLPKLALAQRRWALDNAVRLLTADLRHLQHEAIRRQETLEAAFDVDADTYTLVTVIDPAHPDQDILRRLADDYGADLVTADFGGDTKLTVDAWGRVVAPGTLALSSGPYDATIDIDGDFNITVTQ